MVEISWTRTALKDLREIHNFISNDSDFYADRQILRFMERVEILIKFPLLGRVVPEKEDETIRELIEGNYRIFYKLVSKTQIHILRIHSSSKQIR